MKTAMLIAAYIACGIVVVVTFLVYNKDEDTDYYDSRDMFLSVLLLLIWPAIAVGFLAKVIGRFLCWIALKIVKKKRAKE